jgi:hypothetical protein
MRSGNCRSDRAAICDQDLPRCVRDVLEVAPAARPHIDLMCLSFRTHADGQETARIGAEPAFMLVRDNSWRIGGGMACSFPSVDVFATWVEYVAGTDTHAGRAFTMGLSWPFELGGAHPSQRSNR